MGFEGVEVGDPWLASDDGGIPPHHADVDTTFDRAAHPGKKLQILLSTVYRHDKTRGNDTIMI